MVSEIDDVVDSFPVRLNLIPVNSFSQIMIGFKDHSNPDTAEALLWERLVDVAGNICCFEDTLLNMLENYGETS